MDTLMSVVTRVFLQQVKHQAQGRRKELFACSRISKDRHHAALPILYGIVSLDIPLLKRFIENFRIGKYVGYIRSLTFSIDGDEGLQRHPSGDPVPHPELRERLQCLATMVREMGNFDSLSVVAV